MATANANIVDVYHQRRFTHLPLQSTAVEFVVQTHDHAHVDEIIAALAAAGFPVRLNNGDW